MNAVKGIWKNGQVVLNGLASWPDGTEVIVEPVALEQTLGLRDEDWPTTPDGIARHLTLIEQFEALEFTPEEEADWQTTREAQRQYELSRFEERAKRIEGLFQ